MLHYFDSFISIYLRVYEKHIPMNLENFICSLIFDEVNKLNKTFFQDLYYCTGQM